MNKCFLILHGIFYMIVTHQVYPYLNFSLVHISFPFSVHDYLRIIIVFNQHCFSALFVTDPFLSHGLPVDVENNIKQWPSVFCLRDVALEWHQPSRMCSCEIWSAYPECKLGRPERKGDIYSFLGYKTRPSAAIPLGGLIISPGCGPAHFDVRWAGRGELWVRD